jgi:hypothetical protein
MRTELSITCRQITSEFKYCLSSLHQWIIRTMQAPGFAQCMHAWNNTGLRQPSEHNWNLHRTDRSLDVSVNHIYVHMLLVQFDASGTKSELRELQMCQHTPNWTYKHISVETKRWTLAFWKICRNSRDVGVRCYLSNCWHQPTKLNHASMARVRCRRRKTK